MQDEIQSLIEAARPLLGGITLSRPDMSAGTVAAAIRARSGRVYTGVCLDLSCGIGFCAEHAAVAEMIKGGETEITLVLALSADGPLPPCGRCRELMVQVNRRNLDARVVLAGYRTAELRELIPHHWLFGGDEA